MSIKNFIAAATVVSLSALHTQAISAPIAYPQHNLMVKLDGSASRSLLISGVNAGGTPFTACESASNYGLKAFPQGWFNTKLHLKNGAYVKVKVYRNFGNYNCDQSASDYRERVRQVPDKDGLQNVYLPLY